MYIRYFCVALTCVILTCRLNVRFAIQLRLQDYLFAKLVISFFDKNKVSWGKISAVFGITVAFPFRYPHVACQLPSWLRLIYSPIVSVLIVQDGSGPSIFDLYTNQNGAGPVMNVCVH